MLSDRFYSKWYEEIDLQMDDWIRLGVVLYETVYDGLMLLSLVDLNGC